MALDAGFDICLHARERDVVERFGRGTILAEEQDVGDEVDELPSSSHMPVEELAALSSVAGMNADSLPRLG